MKWTWLLGLVMAVSLLAGAVAVAERSAERTPVQAEPVALIEGEPSLLYLMLSDGTEWLLPRCIHEDSEMNCFWFAEWRGNGEGRDFAVINGTVIYL